MDGSFIRYNWDTKTNYVVEDLKQEVLKTFVTTGVYLRAFDLFLSYRLPYTSCVYLNQGGTEKSIASSSAGFSSSHKEKTYDTFLFDCDCPDVIKLYQVADYLTELFNMKDVSYESNNGTCDVKVKMLTDQSKLNLLKGMFSDQPLYRNEINSRGEDRNIKIGSNEIKKTKNDKNDLKKIPELFYSNFIVNTPSNNAIFCEDFSKKINPLTLSEGATSREYISYDVNQVKFESGSNTTVFNGTLGLPIPQVLDYGKDFKIYIRVKDPTKSEFRQVKLNIADYSTKKKSAVGNYTITAGKSD